MSERSSFIKGTVILICANACAKILGAVFKIPLTYILKEEGMAVYTTAFSAYTLFLTLVTSGFPFAATKLLAEYTAKGREDRIRPVVRSVGVILFILGFIASAVMYIFAPNLALLMREPNAEGAIRAISAAVVLVAVGAVFKSSNEARSNLLPTAFSQVSEAAMKLFCGLYLAYKLASVSLYRAAEGAVFSVTIGEAFATSLLFIMWRISVRKLPKSNFDKGELRAVFSVALPLLLTGGAMGLLSIAEVSTIRSALSDIRFTPESAESFMLKYSSYTDVFDNLPDTLKLTADGIRKLYGGFSGYAQTVFNLPIGIIATVSAAATPMFAKALNIGNGSDVVSSAKKVASIILTLALPSAALCCFFSEEVLYLLFGNRFSADMLRSLAPTLIFLCLANMMISLLHLSGKILEPFLAAAFGLIIKIILSALLIRIPSVNILGAGLASAASSLIIFIAMSLVFKANFGAFIPIIRLTVTPFCGSCVMVGIMKPFNAFLVQNIDCRIAFLASCIIGVLGYFLTLFLMGKKQKML
ncbi:MAG: oligosaccharide flippase family protein [Clostridia bacterium]|nr:oligosaccharide flippase family protein [Clostridia bacterium]